LVTLDIPEETKMQQWSTLLKRNLKGPSHTFFHFLSTFSFPHTQIPYSNNVIIQCTILKLCNTNRKLLLHVLKQCSEFFNTYIQTHMHTHTHTHMHTRKKYIKIIATPENLRVQTLTCSSFCAFFSSRVGAFCTKSFSMLQQIKSPNRKCIL